MCVFVAFRERLQSGASLKSLCSLCFTSFTSAPRFLVWLLLHNGDLSHEPPPWRPTPANRKRCDFHSVETMTDNQSVSVWCGYNPQKHSLRHQHEVKYENMWINAGKKKLHQLILTSLLLSSFKPSFLHYRSQFATYQYTSICKFTFFKAFTPCAFFSSPK